MAWRSADFDYPFSGLKRRLDARPEAFEHGEQDLRATVSQTDPNQTRFCRLCLRPVQEVFVLADNNAVLIAGVKPDSAVGRSGEPNVHHVEAVQSTRGKPTRKRSGQLIVNEKFHRA